MIPNGAIVEKEIPFHLESDYFDLSFGSLGVADIVQAKSAINSFLSPTEDTVTSILLPAFAKAGSFAVTITAATFLTFI